MSDARRALPGVDAVLAAPELTEARARLPHNVLVRAVRDAIAEARTALSDPEHSPAEAPGTGTIAERAAALASDYTRPTLRPVINATGVILHTNLGRAPLATVAVERMARAAEGYTNLEFDLEAGVRGSRYTHCASLLCELTGAEDALVVNNCASALVLALNSVARGRGVAVSRGELIEIGGGFRIPEIVERAGTTLVEVGTTNRTRVGDYREATGAHDVGAFLKVHRSNFRIEGFFEEASQSALRDLAAALSLPFVHDLGSGLMIPLTTEGLPREPTVPEAVEEGADLVVFSGDKLFGGPQAGIIVGKSEWVARARKNPLTRAMRVDRMTLAALEATAELYRDADTARREIPALRMIHDAPESLRERAQQLVDSLGGVGGLEVAALRSVVGGGTLPGAEMPSWGLRIAREERASELAATLRSGVGGVDPVVARVHEGKVLLDLRTVPAARDAHLKKALRLLLS